jgi:hypothetical protein
MKKLLIIALVLLSSCSQKAWQSRGLKKGWVSKDSIYLHDTIRGFDTTFIRQFDTTTLTDTFEVLKEGVKVKTVIQWKNRIVEQTITKRDTVITNVCPPQIQPLKSSWWDSKWLWFIIGFVSLWILDRIITKLFGKL